MHLLVFFLIVNWQAIHLTLHLALNVIVLLHASIVDLTCMISSKIVSTGATPEWDEAFAWAFDSPPKGQKLHISCKNNSKFGKVWKHRRFITLTILDSFSGPCHSDWILNLSEFVVAEIIRESDDPNRPGCHAGLSRWRVHPATREQKWSQ